MNHKLAVNFHHIDACNMKCEFCFRNEKFDHKLSKIEKLNLIEMLSTKFSKITFVGGEPMLDRDLSSMICKAKGLGMTTMLVSNGSLITDTFLEQMKG